MSKVKSHDLYWLAEFALDAMVDACPEFRDWAESERDELGAMGLGLGLDRSGVLFWITSLDRQKRSILSERLGLGVDGLEVLKPVFAAINRAEVKVLDSQFHERQAQYLAGESSREKMT